ncbi:MAG: hypothetical protein KQH57_09655 [Actinomycetales bacterium]|nr:hypothetical protein [Actinomycetales bacterium]
MHEILKFLADPYAFVAGSNPAATAFNLIMVGVTVVLVVVAMLLPFPHGRGAMVPKGDREAEAPDADGQGGRTDRDLTPVA